MPALQARSATAPSARPVPLLRVGVLREGKVVQEALLRPGEGLRLGAEGLVEGKAGRPLFTWEAGVPVLLRPPEGRVRWSRGEGSFNLEEARLPIDAATRGRLEVGGLVVLFQVVAAPALPAPGELRAVLWDADEPLFPGLLAALSLAASLFWAWVVVTPAPEPDALDVQRWVDVVEGLPRIPIAEPVPSVEPGPAEAAPARPAPRPAPAAEAPAPVGVQDSRMQQVIGTLADSALYTELFTGDEEAGRALDRVHGELTASTGLVARSTTREGVVVGLDEARTETVVTGDGHVEVRGKVGVATADVAVDGDPGAISGIVKGFQGSIQSCVDVSVKTHPDLDGRVAVAWKVVGGAVRDAHLVEGNTGDPELEACVVRAVRRFRFPAGFDAEIASYPWTVAGG